MDMKVIAGAFIGLSFFLIIALIVGRSASRYNGVMGMLHLLREMGGEMEPITYGHRFRILATEVPKAIVEVIGGILLVGVIASACGVTGMEIIKFFAPM